MSAAAEVRPRAGGPVCPWCSDWSECGYVNTCDC